MAAAARVYDPSSLGVRCTRGDAERMKLFEGLLYIRPLAPPRYMKGCEFAFSCSATFLLENWPDECFSIDRSEADNELFYAANDNYAREVVLLGCYPAIKPSEALSLLEKWMETSEYQEWMVGRQEAMGDSDSESE